MVFQADSATASDSRGDDRLARARLARAYGCCCSPCDSAGCSVWSSSAGIKVDIDAWSMGCGWLDPSWTDSPSL